LLFPSDFESLFPSKPFSHRNAQAHQVKGDIHEKLLHEIFLAAQSLEKMEYSLTHPILAFSGISGNSRKS
jgi:hypothetical protein